MKKMTYFVMALVLVLGLAQCKKEQPETPQNEGNSVMITLDVKGDNNAKVNVNPPDVTFEDGDEIIVACNGHYVGTLIKTTENNVSKFRGSITNATPGEHLYFYFFGNVSPQYFDTHKYECSVYIGDQTGKLPVISMGQSKETVPSVPSESHYTAILQNKCSLMKFNVTTPSTDPIFIEGMNNFVTVKFDRSGNNGFIDGFKYSQVYNGKIEMKGQEGSGQKTYWAIVLPQDYVAEGIAYTEDYSYVGARPAIEGGIGSNQYYSSGVDIEMVSYDPVGTPLTFEAKEGGATVTLSSEGRAPEVSLYASTNGGTWEEYWVGDVISLEEGQTVMFRGTNSQFATSDNKYNYFSLTGDCYVYGNIMSLIHAVGYADPDEPTQFDDEVLYHFANLFRNCTTLYNHPQKPLQLPATKLGSYCYAQMFWGCTGLTRAPELPANELSEHCYEAMFSSCIGLTASPVLWADALVAGCYNSMFNGCSNLKYITCLASQGFESEGCTSNWVSGVASLGTFTKAPGVSWSSGPNGIPSGWSVQEQ